MKKVEDKMKKEDDAPHANQYELARPGETMEEMVKRILPPVIPDAPETIRRITSGDDLLDQAFNIALNKKIKKK